MKRTFTRNSFFYNFYPKAIILAALIFPGIVTDAGAQHTGNTGKGNAVSIRDINNQQGTAFSPEYFRQLKQKYKENPEGFSGKRYRLSKGKLTEYADSQSKDEKTPKDGLAVREACEQLSSSSVDYVLPLSEDDFFADDVVVPMGVTSYIEEIDLLFLDDPGAILTDITAFFYQNSPSGGPGDLTYNYLEGDVTITSIYTNFFQGQNLYIMEIVLDNAIELVGSLTSDTPYWMVTSFFTDSAPRLLATEDIAGSQDFYWYYGQDDTWYKSDDYWNIPNPCDLLFDFYADCQDIPYGKVNNECAGTIDLTPSGIWANPGTQEFDLATTFSNLPFDCAYTYKRDLWYKLTTDNDGNNPEQIKLTVTPSANADIALALYSGTCGSLNELDCVDDNIAGVAEQILYNALNLTGDEGIETRDNTTYYLRVMLFYENNEFGTFTIDASGSSALPVQLLSFDARQMKDRKVSLLWKVAAEQNMTGYTVERSHDGVHFEAIGTIRANNSASYSLYDHHPFGGTSYYRLKMQGDDGFVQYSRIRQVLIIGDKTISMYPNPTSGVIHISGLEDNRSNALINIFDELGRKVWTGNVASGQMAPTGIDLSRLASGTYVIRVVSEEVNGTMRFVRE